MAIESINERVVQVRDLEINCELGTNMGPAKHIIFSKPVTTKLKRVIEIATNAEYVHHQYHQSAVKQETDFNFIKIQKHSAVKEKEQQGFVWFVVIQIRLWQKYNIYIHKYTLFLSPIYFTLLYFQQIQILYVLIKNKYNDFFLRIINVLNSSSSNSMYIKYQGKQILTAKSRSI